ncbi:hypothetical protein C8R42DRAFT_698343 [Lentinula raphanica]|nr:hypothetical protein C8R42DRAFT_698343 [Lentinula raphanica]
MVRLTCKYPNAYTDFYGSGTPCIFKTGPEWPTRRDFDGYAFIREVRPIYRHPIGDSWVAIGTNIYQTLDSLHVQWTCINPVAYANEGEAKPFCPFVISIGVKPHSLLYDAAVVAAETVQKILADAGFPTIEVAFVESVVSRSAKPLPFDPLHDIIPELRKPFTTALGLPIATHKHPKFEGTGALYFRLDDETKRVVLLTCAHVARPLSVYQNTGMTMKRDEAPENIIAPGERGYSTAVEAVKRKIQDNLRYIDYCKWILNTLGDPVEGEDSAVTRQRKSTPLTVKVTLEKNKQANNLVDELAKHHTTPDQRVIGHVLHSDPIQASTDSYRFTNDWALIELNTDQIDWSSFKGNRIYLGSNLSLPDFYTTMFPQPAEYAEFRYPIDDLLQAHGVVQEDEIRNPRHLDIHNKKCLLVVKNGMKTGTTVGRVNGLYSFTRFYTDHDIQHTSIEVSVLRYSDKYPRFSDKGDSGSIVLTRDGRIVGLLTGGAGPSDSIDITYLTPYWWLEQQIKFKYPSCSLYDEVVQPADYVTVG